MSQKKKTEYVKPHSVSLYPSEHQRYKKHAKDNGLTWAEMVRVLFEEDIENEKNATTLPLQTRRDKLKAYRIKKVRSSK